jgi:hypothetical protein
MLFLCEIMYSPPHSLSHFTPPYTMLDDDDEEEEEEDDDAPLESWSKKEMIW